MININLETELVRNKRKQLTEKDKMVLARVEAFKNIEGSAKLERLGMFRKNMSEAETAKAKTKNLLGYNPDRVFTRDDVKRLCVRYGLRCLPAKFYNGDVDSELPVKILEFEKKYNEIGKYFDSASLEAYICAPKSSFDLQKRPKDPLFFVKVEKGEAVNYILLHKWGKDISAWRWLGNLWKRNIFSMILSVFLFALPIVSLIVAQNTASDEPLWSVVGMCLFISFVSTFFVIFISAMMLDEIGFGPNEHVWDSEFKD